MLKGVIYVWDGIEATLQEGFFNIHGLSNVFIIKLRIKVRSTILFFVYEVDLILL